MSCLAQKGNPMIPVSGALVDACPGIPPEKVVSLLMWKMERRNFRSAADSSTVLHDLPGHTDARGRRPEWMVVETIPDRETGCQGVEAP